MSSAEWPLRGVQALSNLVLPARKAEVEGSMVEVMESEKARKKKTAQALLAVGGIGLLAQLGALWLEAGTAWSRGAEESIGWLGALGVAALQMVDYLAWNPNGILLGATRLLLLFCPVMVMMAGVALSHKGQSRIDRSPHGRLSSGKGK
jgi:hypothetical protein